MKRMLKKLWIGIFFTVLLLALDQFTKQLAVKHLKNAPAIPLIADVFELSYLENRGAAFGMLQGQKALLILVTGLSIAALVYLYLRMPEKKRYIPLRFLFLLLISGAIGNFIDRCAHDYVVDFFYFKLIDFPVFNVADIYVTIAAFLFLALFLFYYKEEEMDLLLKQLLFWKKK